MRDVYRQPSYEVRVEWGLHGVQALAPGSDAIVVVDVLSFTSAVDVALSRGATVFPYRWADETAQDYAESNLCVLAGRRGRSAWSLSPAALRKLPHGTRIVLPSPNGSTLSLATGNVPTFAGCLRNARAVARAASKLGRRIAVIPAGELVAGEGPGKVHRFAIEDLYGAAAIVRHLPGERSPEAQAIVETFEAAEKDLAPRIRGSISGRELIERGFPEDVDLAAELDVSDLAPRLVDKAYVAA